MESLKVRSKKYDSIRFILMGIGCPLSLNNAKISFLIFSIFGPFVLVIAASSSFPHKLTPILTITILIYSVSKAQQAHHFRNVYILF